MIIYTLNRVGTRTLAFCSAIGEFIIFCARAIKTACSTAPKMKLLIEQMYHVGVSSFSIVFLTGISTGLALALQSYIGFSRLGAQDFLGLVVALGMTRELGPVLTGIMITGRCGSAMAAEIGTMQITEQIDALKTLCIDPYQYLIVPRIIASTLILPALTIFSMFCGIVGGYFFCFYSGLNTVDFLAVIHEHLELKDIVGGLIKSGFFGFILACVGTYNGYITRGGAQGVGAATTQSVVIGSILILVANYFLSSLLFQTGIA